MLRVNCNTMSNDGDGADNGRGHDDNEVYGDSDDDDNDSNEKYYKKILKNAK